MEDKYILRKMPNGFMVKYKNARVAVFNHEDQIYVEFKRLNDTGNVARTGFVRGISMLLFKLSPQGLYALYIAIEHYLRFFVKLEEDGSRKEVTGA